MQPVCLHAQALVNIVFYRACIMFIIDIVSAYI